MIGLGFGFGKSALTQLTGDPRQPAIVHGVQSIGVSAAATATNSRIYAQVHGQQVINVDATARLAGTVAAGDPLTLVTSVTKALFFSGDLGVTQSGGVVSQWSDQTGNARHATASGTAKPAVGTLAGRGCLTGDGVDDIMVVAWNPPAPGTQPLWFFLVLRQDTWTAGDYVFAAGSLQLALYQSATTPQLRMANVTASNTNGNLPVGTAGAVEVYFSNSTADGLRAGSAAEVTGSNAGNTDAASFALFARITASFGNVSIACLLATEGKPTSGEIAALRTWAAAYYPGISV